MQTISFSNSGAVTIRSSAGGLPRIATSARRERMRSSTRSRLPTSSVSSIRGCSSENARISGGTNDSAAVVTAMMCRRLAASSTASRTAWRPESSRPTTSLA